VKSIANRFCIFYFEWGKNIYFWIVLGTPGSPQHFHLLTQDNSPSKQNIETGICLSIIIWWIIYAFNFLHIFIEKVKLVLCTICSTLYRCLMKLWFDWEFNFFILIINLTIINKFKYRFYWYVCFKIWTGQRVEHFLEKAATWIRL
jgi:hypothetical protein